MKSTAERVLFALTTAIVIVALFGCQAQPPEAPLPPAPAAPTATVLPSLAPTVPAPDYWPTAGWKSSTPEEQGMDSAQLAAMFDAIDAKHLNLHSVLIIRNGYLVTEAYFTPYDRSVKHQVASVTKSVTGMLTGIAMNQGHFQSSGERVLSLFPDRRIANLDANKRNMTLLDLLTLTSGFDCSDDAGAVNGMAQSPDWVQFALDLPMADAPGTRFRYCSPAVHLLSAILKRATGRNARELANETLFEPLGIPSVTPGEWESDPQGLSEGFAGLWLTPRDMARLGFLYLHRGNWNGKQVVPAAWVAASLTPHTVEEKSGRPYGYLFWIYHRQGYYSAMGLGGQDIHIIPAKNMVVVFTAGIDIPTHDTEVIKLLDEYVVPAAASDRPLAENPAVWAQLQAHISRAARPQTRVAPLPALARSISGKVYEVGDNPAGWQTMSLSFEEGSPEATATINGTQKAPIGLDNVYRTTGGQNRGVALRGHWEGEDTFVVENNNLGIFLQWEYRITFPGDGVRIEVRELVNGNTATVTGRQAH
ncbi:MAG: serine hydrolase [Nitrososphaerales archaeon]